MRSTGCCGAAPTRTAGPSGHGARSCTTWPSGSLRSRIAWWRGRCSRRCSPADGRAWANSTTSTTPRTASRTGRETQPARHLSGRVNSRRRGPRVREPSVMVEALATQGAHTRWSWRSPQPRTTSASACASSTPATSPARSGRSSPTSRPGSATATSTATSAGTPTSRPPSPLATPQIPETPVTGMKHRCTARCFEPVTGVSQGRAPATWGRVSPTWVRMPPTQVTTPPTQVTTPPTRGRLPASSPSGPRSTPCAPCRQRTSPASATLAVPSTSTSPSSPRRTTRASPHAAARPPECWRTPAS